jgi:MFS transporter, DHA1 family, inner membrane transport protein
VLDAASAELAVEEPPAAVAKASLPTLVACLTLGCVALLMLGVQPMVLGDLGNAHRLSIAEMGVAAMVEMLTLGVVAGGLAAAVRHRRLRLWAVFGCALMIIANVVGLGASGLPLALSRGVSGVGGGILVWIATGVVTRHLAAVRLSAVFLGAQSLSQAGLAAVLPSFAPFGWGANAGLIALGAAAVATTPLILLLPRDLPDLPKAEGGHGGFNASGGFGLAAAFLMMAGITGLWVYVDPLAKMDHVSQALASFAIAASLASQILGALLVVWKGRVIPPARTLASICLAFLATEAVFAWIAQDGAFVAAALVFGFLWIASLPLFVPLLIEVDPTRRSAMLIPGAQLLGGSAGPLLTGLIASDANVRPVLTVSSVLFVAAIAALGLAFVARRRGATG